MQHKDLGENGKKIRMIHINLQAIIRDSKHKNLQSISLKMKKQDYIQAKAENKFLLLT